MAAELESLVKDIRAAGVVDRDTVLRLRRDIFPDGIVSRHEAEQIFDINDLLLEPTPDWSAFFIEAIVDYCVHQSVPQGFVDAAGAAFLIEHIARDGMVRSETELELLVKVLEVARAVPDSLQAFALRQVHAAVTGGVGDLFDGSALTPGAIGAGEVRLLRRILFAPGAEGGIGVSRAEAEALFDIADATAEQRNDPSFDDLFSKAIANHLFSACGIAMASREQALASADWADSGAGIDWSKVVDPQTWTAILAEGIGGLLRNTGEAVEVAYARRNQAAAAAQTEASVLSAQEADWLIERLGRDGQLAPAEKALIDVIETELGRLPERLVDATRALRGRVGGMSLRDAASV